MCERAPDGPSFESLQSAFLKLAETRLSPTQKTVLQASVNTLHFRELTLTALADLVSRKTSVPYSTVKWNLRSLVDLGFLEGGDAVNRGEPARFTKEAEMVVQHLNEIES
ncbi:MAG: hypothetical protein ACW98Y_06920 [Candidatus Thorarchaeota archaeon]